MKLKEMINKYLFPKHDDSKPRDTISIYTFHVAGITYHDDELQRIIKGLRSECMLEKYQALTNAQIKEYGANMSIYEGQYIKGAKLEPYVHKNKDAIKVILPDYKGNWYEVGSVPKDHLEDVIALLEEPDKIKNIEFEIVGGDVKGVDYDDNNKPFINEFSCRFGIAIYIYYEDTDE